MESQDEAQRFSMLRAKHYSNVLKNVYARGATVAAAAQQQPQQPPQPQQPQQPQQQGEDALQQAQRAPPVFLGAAGQAVQMDSSWRARALQQLGQPAAKSVARRTRAESKDAAPQAPQPLKPLVPLQVPPILLSGPKASGSARAEAAAAAERKHSETKSQDAPAAPPGRQSAHNEFLRDLLHRILRREDFVLRIAGDKPAPSAALTLPSDADIMSGASEFGAKLPLELFDDGEMELHSPEEWIELGREQGGTPGSSLFYNGREWRWTACKALDYDAQSHLFLVEFFQHGGKRKEVTRLALCFDAEPRSKFELRVRQCQDRREALMAVARLATLVQGVSDEVVSPMEPRLLRALVDRVMSTAASVAKQRRGRVEELLVEARRLYTLAMKAHVVEQKRRHPRDSQLLSGLRLPPLPAPPRVGYLAVKAIPERDSALEQLVRRVTAVHCWRHAGAPAVLRFVHEAWQRVSDALLIDGECEKLPLPLTLFEFQEHQDEVFTFSRDRIVTDWRSAVINRIRDAMAGAFNFFVSEPAEYAGSPLSRFIKLVVLMGRDLLNELARRSVLGFLEFLERYSAKPLEHQRPALMARRLSVTSVAEEAALVGAPRSGPRLRPLFVFKMTCQKGEVVFLPELSSMEEVLLHVLDVPHRLATLMEMEQEVVPLMGISERAALPLDYSSGAAVKTAAERARQIVRENLEQPLQLAALYKQYSYLLRTDPTEHADKWFATEPAHSLDEVREELGRLHSAAEEIARKSPSEVSFRMVTVQCEMVKSQLIEQARRISSKLLEGLAKQARAQCLQITQAFETIISRITAKPNDAHELAALKQLAQDVEKRQIPLLQQEIGSMKAKLALLDQFHFPISTQDFTLSWTILRYPQQVLDVMQQARLRLSEDSVKFQAQLSQEREQFHKNVSKYASEIEAFVHFGQCSLAEMEEYASQVESLRDKLNKADQQVKSFNERDVIFEVEPREYKELVEIKREFDPFYQLWSTASDFHASHSVWMTGPLIELQPNKIADSVEAWFKLMVRLEKQLQEVAPEPAKVAEDMKNKISDFRKHVPVIQWLRSPGLRPRHWSQISAVLGQQLVPDHSLTLSTVLVLPVHKHAEKIEEICTGAEKEYALEQALDKMVSEWKGLTMDIEEYKNTKTYILKKSEDIITLLDDQIMKTQAMRGSPYIKPFEARTKKWESKLQLLQAVMEEWLLCQKTWLYLEPIFSSEDIVRQMPTESRRFGVVDAYWRKTMNAALHTPNAMEFVSETDSLLKGFQESNKMLELISKGLNDYLETKRLAFPRFYFLSNDELLNILSQTKDPTAVQPHLSKCFDNMVSLQFSAQQVIEAMFSAEGERVDFCEAIDPNQGAKKGNVEVWLKDVERIMRSTLRTMAGSALKQYKSTPREKWVLAHPGQIILAVSQIMWTAEVTSALQRGYRGLDEYARKLSQQLHKLVELVRSDLSPLHRMTLGALTVIDVHARDVVAKMVEQRVANTADFEWLRQLRYYWEDGDQLRVCMVNTTVDYGYEYLGNTPRLVITPLTDRAYATLMGAIQLHLGGAPEGPAGTGKTETVKDLSKAVGVQCVVFNCSDGLDYLAMAKFFKGLAASGAWSCFDEFNRIELEVLSVIAQQVSSIQRAILEGKTQFFFEGVNIPLVRTCAVFITMNPGYAGRSELPDNLKALFRTVAMMVPDYALIAEIVLYSYGYSDARPLSRKIVACLRLASEQLSSQDHYDFGMRNLKSILTAAGALKRKEPELSEGILVLRAINDCNLPKFTAGDVPLFQGITKDLFPDVELPQRNQAALVQALKQACVRFRVEPTPHFLAKCLELYETVLVRHGLMLVGQAWSGKSKCLQVTAHALSALDGSAGYHRVRTFHLNPKSITQGQLYGQFDLNTHEWTDGVLPVAVRECVADATPALKWVIFDGPVDALWIESMNTVLDDNKKLCLASGEIIKLTNSMTMMFEVEDLAVASPATVSRCGMVYLEPKALGWRPLVDSWLSYSLPPTLHAHREALKALCDWLLPPTLEFVRRKCKSVLPNEDAGLVANLLRLFNSLLDDFWVGQRRESDDAVDVDSSAAATPSAEDSEAKGKGAQNDTDEANRKVQRSASQLSLISQISNPDLAAEEARRRQAEVFVPDEAHAKWLECFFAFSVVWSLGANTDTQGRARFSDFFRALVAGEAPEDADVAEELDVGFRGRKIGVPFPTEPEASVYDFTFAKESASWVRWMDTVPPFQIAPKTEIHEIIVPTLDTVRHSWLLGTLLTHGRHVLFTGDTGTGKSVVIQHKILQGLDREKYVPLMLSFSARTSANQTQDIIDNKLERRRQGILGPPLYKKCIIFVDDLNMPSKEQYGAQPPIELLRQWMDYGGWYDRATQKFKRIVDVQFVGAMGPPGGGRNHVTKRYLRHYSSVYLPPYDTASLQTIFSCISRWWLGSFPQRIQALGDSLVHATIDAYKVLTAELLPTPAKSHYTFNLRDVSKVFQGMASTHAASMIEPADLARTWLHEMQRVFGDRLVSEADSQWFTSMLGQQLQRHFELDARDVLGEDQRALIFADFADPRAAVKQYAQVKDIDRLRRVVEEVLDDYNTVSKNRMNLVLFDVAIEHVARISRIIRQPGGNALLVGVGGSGRQSLTRLAASMADYEVVQVEITRSYGVAEWRDDLRALMRKSGLMNKPVVFLIADTQIKHESFVEDVNNILNNGEVPNLFPADELAQILEELAPAARKVGRGDGNAAIYSFFVQRCRMNTHVVFCMSPVGTTFRTRLRMFPSLVNCTTIDWFHPWPTAALRSVATRFLQGVDASDAVKAGLVDVCVDMQERVVGLSAEYKQELGRHNYVTPTSYLELIKTFSNLFESKRRDIGAQKMRYENGLKKLEETAVQVREMQQQLEILRPQLIQSSRDTEELMKTIESRSAEVSRTRLVVEAEEVQCNEQASAAAKIKEECEAALNEAMPALESALRALKVINKSDLIELKSMKQPPSGVVVTMQALCIMLGEAPVKVGQAGQKKDDYWEAAKRSFLRDGNFIETLQQYDKDNIAPEVIQNIRPLIKNPEFSPSKIAKASKAAEGFCKWVRAMEVYDRVAKDVKPKREALNEAEKKHSAAAAQLAQKKAQLAEVQALLDELNRQFVAVNAKKVQLQEQVEECSKRLDRAEKLIGGLGGEKQRWMVTAQRLREDFDNVIGNILVAAGVIAYLGVFTSAYRQRIIAQWVELLRKKGIACDANFALHRVLGDPVQIRQWGIQHLPKDDFSVDNAIILTRSMRWGLLIDPQGQASRWLKHKEAGSNLKVVKQTDAQFSRQLSNAVQFGLPLLVENVGESLEPLLEPLLLRQTFKQGGRLMITLGGENMEYNENFRLYLTTKLANPHYPPEIVTKVTLINFMITPEGLEDQMLGIVVSQEEPELERERGELIVKSAENQRQLQEIEDRILHLLNESKGMILDDEELIDTLQKSKVASSTIEKRVAAAAKTEERINKTRADFQSVASNAATLFFCISELALVDPMYQYSLSWFIALFVRSIGEAAKHHMVSQRTQSINQTFTHALYRNVCRSLFEKDKLLFSFLLNLKLSQSRKQLNAAELRMLLTGGIVDASAVAASNPASQWLSANAWGEVLNLSKLSAFAGFREDFVTHLAGWQRYFEHRDPFALEELPGGWHQKLSPFQRMLVLRCLRPDKLVHAIQRYVKENMGEAFIQPPPFNLEAAYADSNQCTPLLFILSPGVDPSSEVFKFALSKGFGNLENISLGQGQGPIAEQAIREAVDKGSWVLLQNCHLAVSWLPTLERIVDELSAETTNVNFRLWLTSAPSPLFPVSLLQNGVKMTNEPPKGLRMSLLQSWNGFDDKLFNDASKPQQLKKLLFSLTFFHAVVLERRKFGPLGWNIPYEFTESDLRISVKQLEMLLDQYDEVPFTALKYLVGQLNYGGRVTDDWDRRTLSCLLQDFMNPRVLNDKHQIDSRGIYAVPSGDATTAQVVEYATSLPLNEEPDVFGLDANAEITSAIKESHGLLGALLTLQPKTSNASSGAASGGAAAAAAPQTREAQIAATAREIEARLPAKFDVELASRKFPVVYANSMNTVFVQELIRYNRLLDAVRSSLQSLQRALKGEVVMSDDLEAMATSLFNGMVPKLWSAVAYPSLKPLGAWVGDLLQRLGMFASWLQNGPPSAFWVSGFFFTQSFLTGTMQNYARKYRIPIDELSFDFEVMDHVAEDTKTPPADGCYIYGLFLEGARWDSKLKAVAPSLPKQLFTKMPVIWLKPVHNNSKTSAAAAAAATAATGSATLAPGSAGTKHAYTCPVYKTSRRAGTLSTTGHSTNFVLAINLPCTQDERFWVKRGVALLCQLDT